MTVTKTIGDWGEEATLLVTEGQDLVLDVYITDEAGAALDIDGWEAFSEIRSPDSPDGAAALATFDIDIVGDPVDGHFRSAPIPSAVTKLIPKAKAEWDFWTRVDGVLKPRMYGPVLVRKPATRGY
jgi:hypothetical protein